VYRGPIELKLRNLVASEEFSSVVDLLVRLREEGVLEDFFCNALDYLKELDLFSLALESQEPQGTTRVWNALRSGFSRAWPRKVEGIEAQSFELLKAFWQRVRDSSVLDGILADVFPSAIAQGAHADFGAMMADEFYVERFVERMFTSQDERGLMNMTADLRRREISKRVYGSMLTYQSGVLFNSFRDQRFQMIEVQISEFVIGAVGIFERKIAGKIEEAETAERLKFVPGLVAVATLVVIFGIWVAVNGWPSPVTLAVPAYLAGINGYTYSLFRRDKQLAEKKQFRVSEAELCNTALAGGWPAGYYAMGAFRHKTAKLSFRQKYDNATRTSYPLGIGAFLLLLSQLK